MKCKFLILSGVVFFLLAGCSMTSSAPVATANRTVDFNKTRFMGRVTKSKSMVEMFWSGTSASITFEGTTAGVWLKDENGANYFDVIIDHDSITVLHPDNTKHLYLLATNLPKGTHTITLFKRTEWTRGKTNFYGFQLNAGAIVFPTPPKEKNIEFYGNSITAGYAVGDYSGKDSPDSIFTNNYDSYAAVTARYFDAGYTCIARSGIGIMVSWFPMIMKDMYYRKNPADADSYWDFNQFKPDIVVINLLQNDSWLIKKPEYIEFKHRFGHTPPTSDSIIRSYREFVQTIRSKYPEAQIICMLGNMDITQQGSIWPGYVEKAVAALNDKKIHTLFAPYKGTPGHPRVEEQQQLADTLITFIEKKHLWQ